MTYRTMCRSGWLVALVLAAGSQRSSAQQIVVEPGKPQAVYAVGERIWWDVTVAGPHPEKCTSAHFVLKRDGFTELKTGEVDLRGGHGMIETQLNQPGAVLAFVTSDVPGDDGKAQRVLGGAMVDPQKIRPSTPPPADFDSFWAEQIATLNEVPENAQLTPVPDVDPAVSYAKLRMDNISQSHIYAQFAEPVAEKNSRGMVKRPALLILQWAGVYGLPSYRVVQPAQQGWMALNVMPHDLPFDQPDDFYKKLADTTLKDYFTFGNDKKETSYYLRMYLSAYRAAQYLMHRPDWDGHTLVIMGTSQGGQQTISLAGLLGEKVSAMMALVPSGCDVTGQEVGRATGFPYWADQANQKHNPAIVEAGRYYDPVNFAAHITCPALVAMGLIDETSPPTGVFAAINQMKGLTVPLILVHSPHQDVNGSQNPYNEASVKWLDALVHGKPVPPQ